MRETTHINDGMVYLNAHALRHAEKQEFSTPKGHWQLSNREIREMMNNYRSYEQAYNDSLIKLNHQVDKYNEEVYAFVEKNNAASQHVDDNTLFEGIYGRISALEYNTLVEAQNEQNKRQTILKKNLKPLRQPHEQTFQTLLLIYGRQISRGNDAIKNPKYKVRQLPKVKIAANNFTENDFLGNRRNNVSNQTVRNHLYRLRDAGVIFGYEYHGQSRPVDYYVNSEIFVVFDRKNRCLYSPDNEKFTFSMYKNFIDSYGITGANINRKIIKEPVDKSPGSEYGAPQSPTSIGSQMISLPAVNNVQGHHKSNIEKKSIEAPKKQTRAVKNCKNSQHLGDMIDDKGVFVTDLYAGKYDQYDQMDHIKSFEKESTSGNLTNAEFRTLLLQEFIKIFATQWKDETVNNWGSVVDLFYDHYLKTPNQKVPTKEVQFYYYKNLIWRKDFVFRYLKRNKNFKLCTPSVYFNPFLKDNKGFFAYTEKNLVRYLERKNKFNDRQEKLQKQAYKIKKNQNTRQKIDAAIARMDKSRITYKELIAYIENNIPNAALHIERLPVYIENYYLNFSKSA